jgi:hypothetical protein
MDESVAETWSWRELPLLRIALRDDDRGATAQFEDMARETGLELRQVWLGMRNLRDSGYVNAYLGNASSGFVNSVAERTRRELGSWPSPESLVDGLARAFAEAAERETDPERKSKLRTGAEMVGGAGRTMTIEIVTAFLRQQLGLP